MKSINFDRFLDPPEPPEPSPKYEEAYAILEAAGVEQSVIDRVCDIIDQLSMCVLEAESRECPKCAMEAAKAEAEAQEAYDKAHGAIQTAEWILCPHGKEFMECNPCLIADDLAFDALREGKK